MTPSNTPPAVLDAMARQFLTHGDIKNISPLGNGRINTTFLVKNSGENGCFVLQRLNSFVFTDPEAIMANIRTFSSHATGLLKNIKNLHHQRWEIIDALVTGDGRELAQDDGGAFWRAIPFIDNAVTLETVQSQDQAREIGKGLAIFHMLSRDIPVADLADTLPGFHVTPRYLDQYDMVIANGNGGKNAEEKACFQFVDNRRHHAHVLENAQQEGILNPRAIHGDPKVNNFMVDDTTGRVVCLIDLDTIVPGLIHYDIGDCLRSVCNPAGEDPTLPAEIRFEPDLCRAMLQGYLKTADTFLTDADYDYLFDAIRLIPFELGLRFFTDYLEGNPYFKNEYPKQNLVRAMTQFRLAESIEKQEETIRTMINDLRPHQ